VSEYFVTFTPETYVKGMYLEIGLPEEIKPEQVWCASKSFGVDDTIDCQYSDVFHTIRVRKAFDTSDFEPERIQFSIGNYTNPSDYVETSSFKIRSFTDDDFMIDSREDSLTLNFECARPCQTCLASSNTQCATCFTDGL